MTCISKYLHFPETLNVVTQQINVKYTIRPIYFINDANGVGWHNYTKQIKKPIKMSVFNI